LKLATFKATHQTPVAAPVSHDFAYEGSAMKVDLFNKVVRLKPGAMTEGSEFSYWYVLHIICNQTGELNIILCSHICISFLVVI
jgi:hypothetical protein